MQIDPVMRRMREAWQTPPLPPLPPTRRQRDPAPERQVDYHWVGSNARHAGTLVHRWLQKIADGDVALDLPRDELLAVSTRWAAGLGVEQNDVPEITRRVADALAAVAGDATGRWLLNGEGAAELRVSGLLEGRRNNVIIDRVRIDAGEHWLIDYKTGTHEGSDLEGFIAQEVDRYRTQLAHYLALYRHLTDAPVRTALYFPLLGRFVEVDVAMAQEEPRPDH
ncbi:MAG: PD-(D/E)XK nuclease family protein [Woeseiaceae bacterium]|nr:PD-(D/E)XK nuclease family protein [Woeseiaceae bacterium]